VTVTDITKHKFFAPALAAVLAGYYTLPFLLRLEFWGGRDWDLFTTIAAVPVGSIVHYGQFPFWNPYLGGGNILFHHPEVAVLSPFLLFYLIFGAVVGLKLQVLICYFLGFFGSIRLAERLGMSMIAAAMVSVAYFGSVHFALHFAEGHMPFTHFCFMPWYLYFLLRSENNLKYLIGAAVSLALMVLGNGAAVPLLYTLTFCGLLLVLVSLVNKNIVMLKRLILSAVTGLGLAAVKFLPMAVYLTQNRWEGNPDESIPLSALRSIFFGREHTLYARNFPEQYWAWHEYGAYLSPLLIVLAVTALALHWRRRWYWLALLVFFLLLGLGSFGWCAPWSLLSHLPGFSSVRCTGRAFQFVILSAAVLGGFGLDLWRQRLRSTAAHRWLRFLPLTAAAFVVATNLVLVWPIMKSAFTRPPETAMRAETFRHVVDDEPQAYRNYLANRGSLVTPWLSAYHPSRGLVDALDNVRMEYVLSDQVDSLHRDYTPNRIIYRFFASQPGEMVVGMGYDPGWRAEDGRELTEQQGLMAFHFDRGSQSVSLVYRTPYFYAGLVVTIVFFLGVIVITAVTTFRFRKR